MGGTFVAYKAGSGGVAGHIDSCAVNGEDAIAAKGLVVGASGIEAVEYFAEYVGGDLGATLGESRWGHIDPSLPCDLSQRAALCPDQ